MAYPLYAHERAHLEENLQLLEVQIHFFTLKPTLETALYDRGRKLTSDGCKCIPEMYEPGGECHGDHLGTVIDNTSLSPQQAAQKILKCVKFS